MPRNAPNSSRACGRKRGKSRHANASDASTIFLAGEIMNSMSGLSFTSNLYGGEKGTTPDFYAPPIVFMPHFV